MTSGRQMSDEANLLFTKGVELKNLAANMQEKQPEKSYETYKEAENNLRRAAELFQGAGNLQRKRKSLEFVEYCLSLRYALINQFILSTDSSSRKRELRRLQKGILKDLVGICHDLIDIYKQLNLPKWAVGRYFQIGQFYFDAGKFRQAEEYLKESLEIADKLNTPITSAWALFHLAFLPTVPKWQRKRYLIDSVEKFHEASEETKSMEYEADSNRLLSCHFWVKSKVVSHEEKGRCFREGAKYSARAGKIYRKKGAGGLANESFALNLYLKGRYYLWKAAKCKRKEDMWHNLRKASSHFRKAWDTCSILLDVYTYYCHIFFLQTVLECGLDISTRRQNQLRSIFNKHDELRGEDFKDVTTPTSSLLSVYRKYLKASELVKAARNTAIEASERRKYKQFGEAFNLLKKSNNLLFETNSHIETISETLFMQSQLFGKLLDIRLKADSKEIGRNLRKIWTEGLQRLYDDQKKALKSLNKKAFDTSVDWYRKNKKYLTETQKEIMEELISSDNPLNKNEIWRIVGGKRTRVFRELEELLEMGAVEGRKIGQMKLYYIQGKI